MILLLVSLLTATPPRPTGTITLDMANPVVTATIGTTRLRLRVALDQKGVVELNGPVAAALMLPFEADDVAMVGRVPLPGRIAPATIVVAGRVAAVTVSTHDVACCAGVDGEIAPDLLPFAELRLVGAPVAGATVRTIAMERDPAIGLFARVATRGGTVLAMMTLAHDATIATASGAAALAKAGGGRFVGTLGQETRAFGIARPVRTMQLTDDVDVAGFAVDRLLVRVSDFRGAALLPPVPEEEEGAEDAIVVRARRRAAQRAIPTVTIGRDLLRRCSELRLAIATRVMTLTCAS